MQELDNKNFDKGVSNIKDKTVVLFYADWCPFCRKFKPVFESYDDKADARLAEAKINDEDNPLWDKYKIEVVPTIVAFKGGRVVARRDGKAGMGLFDEDLKALLKEISA
jgi:thioredoxin 1